MKYVADLHLHSKYSRAVSPQMTLPVMAQYAVQKGINVLTTGDFTHPLWFRQIQQELEEAGEGVYKLNSKSETRNPKIDELKFILTVEVACIYSQGGKGRRIHCLIFAPSVEVAGKINAELTKRGANLSADGRPIIGLSAKQLLQLILDIDERCLLIPCHAWTPWFSLYGSMSGFDSIEECFEDLSNHIYGIETGLSSDPMMNWRIKELDNRSILSFSDSHSPMKMGREATVFDLKEISYGAIAEAIKKPFQLSVLSSQLSESGSPVVQLTGQQKTDNRISCTFEFYPEEGKYHYTGHRNCGIIQGPIDDMEKGTICPVCHRPLTVGVMHRVEDLASNSEEFGIMTDKFRVKWVTDPKKLHPPFVKLVPLNEIIAEVLGIPISSTKVREMFDKLCNEFGSEIAVLLKTQTEVLEKIAGPKIALGVSKVRSGDITLRPGFDGEYGIVKIDLGEGNHTLTDKETVSTSDSQIALDI